MKIIDNWLWFIRKAFGIIWVLCNVGSRLSCEVTASISLADSEKGPTTLVCNFVYVNVSVSVSLYLLGGKVDRCMCVMGVGELLKVSLKGIFSNSSPGFGFVKGSG